MSETTSIEWCDSTFNPWVGCTKVSPACDHCYAERDMAIRLKMVEWGAGKPRHRTSAANWRKPILWNQMHVRLVDGEPLRSTGATLRGGKRVTEHAVPLNDRRDSRMIDPADWDAAPVWRRRVFCASLADVFDNEVPASWRADLFGLIRSTPNLDWLLLTKRIGNAERMIDEAGGWSGIGGGGGLRNPLPNVWLGATVVTQEEADRDIPKLLATPARVRFLSIEPMRGAVDLSRFLDIYQYEEGDSWRPRNLSRPEKSPDWVIAGGESGPHARPAHPDWFRSLRDQCAGASVPFLFKQHGEWVSAGEPAFGKSPCREIALLRDDGSRVDPASAEGRDENAPVVTMSRVTKKQAGRLLDGVEHNGFPA